MPTTEPAADDSTLADEELEKRKKRAARFGVPLVETPKPRPSPTKRGLNTPRTVTTRTAPPGVCSRWLLLYVNFLMLVQQEYDKLQARAARFGIGKPAEPMAKKRSVEEVVDAEELEKRKKRAERFGIPPVVCLLPFRLQR
jgi:SAP domain-containing ribonucleoprotein